MSNPKLPSPEPASPAVEAAVAELAGLLEDSDFREVFEERLAAMVTDLMVVGYYEDAVTGIVVKLDYK
jgi:hypothetical protein